MFNIAQNEAFLTEIGIANAPADTKQKIIDDLEGLAQKKLIGKIANRISDAQAAEFESIADQKQSFEWLMRNIPELPSLISGVLAEMREEILSQKNKVVGK